MRLETYHATSSSLHQNQFQFQTGAIRRKLFTIQFEDFEKFQFQTGAIRSDRVTLWRDAVTLLNFNSKLVRLEVVRLDRISEYNLFQFQTGAIRRLEDEGCYSRH